MRCTVSVYVILHMTTCAQAVSCPVSRLTYIDMGLGTASMDLPSVLEYCDMDMDMDI